MDRIVADCPARRPHLPRRLSWTRGWPPIPYDGRTAHDPPGRAADGRQSAGSRRLRRTMRALSIPSSASAASPRCAWRYARRRRHSPRPASAFPPSIARSASTAAPASGAAPPACPARPREPPVPRRRGRAALGGELKMPGYHEMPSTSSSAARSCPTRCRPWSRSPAPAGPALKNEMMLPAVLDPWAGHALYEAANLAARGARQQGLAGQPRPQGQAAAGDDDRRPRRCRSSWSRSTARPAASPMPPRSRPRWPRPSQAIPGLDRSQPAALRRLGVGLARRRRHPADGRRAARHHRPVPGRGPAHRPGRRQLARSWSASRAAAPGLGLRRRRRRCSAGPPATCPSRRTTRRSAWPTCAAIMPALQKAKPRRVGSGGVELRVGEPAQAARARPAS